MISEDNPLSLNRKTAVMAVFLLAYTQTVAIANCLNDCRS